VERLTGRKTARLQQDIRKLQESQEQVLRKKGKTDRQKINRQEKNQAGIKKRK
jgi:hypothetical protein